MLPAEKHLSRYTRWFFAVLGIVSAVSAAWATDDDWVRDVNGLGIQILRSQPPGNAAVSPTSLSTALLMTWAGTAGETRSQMTDALGFDESTVVADSRFWDDMRVSAKEVTILQANRLFLQDGLPLLESFRNEMRETFDAPIETVDFGNEAQKARKTINHWVAKQTNGKIKDLIPEGGVDGFTRLVLVNAVYFLGAWQAPFEKFRTEPGEFFIGTKETAKVPMMHQTESFGLRAGDDYTALTLPYKDPALQMLIILPRDAGGLPALEARLSPQTLRELADLPPAMVDLFLPRFRLETGTMEFVPPLKKLGVKRLFDDPPYSSDLSGMVKGGGNLYVSHVFQQVFVDVSEEGTEAAAATAVVVSLRGAPMGKSTAVQVDHPFLFAIQHRESGVCLFLGRVTDPR